ncbi:MAG: sulfite exporter TauE/SafE family protein [Mastigocoleus sp.]
MNRFFVSLFRSMIASRSLRTSFLCTVFVWTLWLTILSPSKAINNAIAHWEVAVTMIFGSMVAGGTSMGGGAVAFPVLTKWLEVPPGEAKVFSLAIQSIGMSAASLTIIAMKAKMEWKFIFWGTIGGIVGIILGTFWLAPILPAEVIKMSFTMMISSFAILLLILNSTPRKRGLTIPFWGRKERVFALATGVIGGIISSLVGSGMDIFSFSVMVLLFGLCEKVSTPTSVILMAINAVSGFLLHKFIIGDFVESVTNYWLAAVPVVVIGAPVGALLCSLLRPETITKTVVILIWIELVSSLLLIPLNAQLICFSVFVFLCFSIIYYWMYQSKIYTQRKKF